MIQIRALDFGPKKPVFEKNSVLRLSDRDFGPKKPVFEKKSRFAAF